MKPVVRVFKSPAEMAAALAIDFANALQQCVENNRLFYVVLSGGSTPAPLFRALAGPPFAQNLPWKSVHLFWGDERCVPPDHPDSNYRLARELLLAHLSIPPENIHRIRGEDDPAREARRYEDEIRALVPPAHSNTPRFDWIHLGLGADGHTASLFPEAATLEERRKLCAIAFRPTTGQLRVTLTLPAINHARRVTFLATGAAKAAIVNLVTSVENADKLHPATFVKPVDGILEWCLDKPAARLL